MPSLTLREIARQRMRSQHVWAPLPAPADVVRSLGAMQAQEFRIALWSVAQRTRNVDESSVLRAFDEGAILRTHILRPTWHFVAAEDLRWMLALSGPRVDRLNASRYRELDLDEKLFERATRVITRALGRGKHLTRKELGVELERARISTAGQRLAYIVMRAELDGVICSGALRGKQQTYALLDHRAPETKQMSRDDALAELTKRYFTSRGPATLKDLARWSSLTMSDCRSGLEAVRSELRRQEVDGKTYWFTRRPSQSHQGKVVDLVQIYDELIMGYSDSRDALRASDIDYRTDVVGPSAHAVLLDGQMIGHWKAGRTKDAVEITIALHRSLCRSEKKAVGDAGRRFGRFLQASVGLSMSE